MLQFNNTALQEPYVNSSSIQSNSISNKQNNKEIGQGDLFAENSTSSTIESMINSDVVDTTETRDQRLKNLQNEKKVISKKITNGRYKQIGFLLANEMKKLMS